MQQAVVLRNRQLREIRHTQTLLDLKGQPDLRAAGDYSELSFDSIPGRVGPEYQYTLQSSAD